jgi:hypothetical protein
MDQTKNPEQETENENRRVTARPDAIWISSLG